MSISLPGREAAPAVPSFWRGEVKPTLLLALPLAGAQVGQIAINTLDVLLLGWLGAEPLAAAALGLAVLHVLLMFGLGTVTAASALTAQLIGAGQEGRIPRLVAQGGLVTALVIALLMLVATQLLPFLALTGQDPALLARTGVYLQALIWEVPGFILFTFLRCVVTAFGIGRPVLLITLLAIPLNALLAYGLIFGAPGLPALGILGSGLASAITQNLMALSLLGWCLASPRMRAHMPGLAGFRPDRRSLRQFLGIGLPIGVSILLESGMFTAAGLMMGLLGAIPLAAHQVTLQIVALAFMVALGIGQAATIRVGRAAGARDLPAARRAGLAACGLGGAFMTMTALAFALHPHLFVDLFLPGNSPTEREAAETAALLLRLGGLFQLADGLQVIAGSALRGLNDTRVPLLIAAFGYWGVGFPACLTLGLLGPLGPPGIWLGLALGLSVVATILLRRFLRLTGGQGVR